MPASLGAARMMAAPEPQSTFVDEGAPVELHQPKDEAEQGRLRDDEISAEVSAFESGLTLGWA
ncbi:hypothetical protein [Burkholderia thailandensis]|uniref:hypothetical protein n=1 Tax=Burkholderia thailandensis TaxID=57975 RepID=UPI00016A75BC|nr:hypothetical protein [Burkholderia thailandensis]AOJ47170.1 hypothetical protein WJ27_18295 [Burkholderia thailandensis]AVR07278.1 hypothetical protein A8H31_07055 [Burkholderia thailandensis]AWY61345.1 hypothetical protein A8H35_24460 [Burkholderia thailandensis]AWY65421.1 hypothetical protein A8H36_09600 [Burkholderia thailandensis]KVG13080.1 hypothetical protein WJ25_05120 [Burkholderia thailandensis]